MNDFDRQGVCPDFFVGYHPDTQELFVTVDAEAPTNVLDEAINERVRRWTSMNGVVLGEGYMYLWQTKSVTHPVSISMRAPVIFAGSLTKRYAAIIHIDTLVD